jgi:hypothetical protein
VIAAWPCWRLWLEDKASLSEINAMTMYDVDTANRILDASARASWAAREKAK